MIIVVCRSSVWGPGVRPGVLALLVVHCRTWTIDRQSPSAVRAGVRHPAWSACVPCGQGSHDYLPCNEDDVSTMLARVDVVEVFSPPRVALEATKYGLKASDSWDITQGWGFTIKEHQEAADKYIDEHKPLLLIGSPPCAAFCQLQSLSPHTPQKKS